MDPTTPDVHTARDTAVKLAVRIVAAGAMVAIGVAHFVVPDGFVKIVPSFLPAPRALVFVSGFFEILGGLGLLVPRTRYAAAIGLIVLFVAVFPANINMAVNDIQLADAHVPSALLWLRLPFQLAFIVLAWWLRRGSPAEPPRRPLRAPAPTHGGQA